jgi:hypothetical protein
MMGKKEKKATHGCIYIFLRIFNSTAFSTSFCFHVQNTKKLAAETKENVSGKSLANSDH